MQGWLIDIRQGCIFKLLMGWSVSAEELEKNFKLQPCPSPILPAGVPPPLCKLKVWQLCFRWPAPRPGRNWKSRQQRRTKRSKFHRMHFDAWLEDDVLTKLFKIYLNIKLHKFSQPRFQYQQQNNDVWMLQCCMHVFVSSSESGR